MKKPDIKVVYWDLGGVCVTDNVEPTFRAFGFPYDKPQEEAWKEYKLGKINQEEFWKRSIDGLDKIMLAEKLGGETEEGKSELAQKMAREAKARIQIYGDGALPLVEQLNNSGRVLQGIISNHSTDWGRYIMNDRGLARYFDPHLVIISADVGLDKSGTEIFRLAAKRASEKLGDYVFPCEILFNDNQKKNVDIARETGINAEIFGRREQMVPLLNLKYGFDLKHTTDHGGK